MISRDGRWKLPPYAPPWPACVQMNFSRNPSKLPNKLVQLSPPGELPVLAFADSLLRGQDELRFKRAVVRRGKNRWGLVVDAIPEPAFEGWDDFARKHGLARRESYPLRDLQEIAISRIGAKPGGLLPSLPGTPAEWHDFWAEIHQKKLDRLRSLERVSRRVHKPYYNRGQQDTVDQARDSLTDAVLSAPAFWETADCGADPAEILDQLRCDQERGTLLMLEELEARFRGDNANIARLIFDWELETIERARRKAGTLDTISEMLVLPKPVQGYFECFPSEPWALQPQETRRVWLQTWDASKPFFDPVR